MNLKINIQNQVRIECLEYITYFTYSCTHIILPQVPLYLFFSTLYLQIKRSTVQWLQKKPSLNGYQHLYLPFPETVPYSK